MVRTLDETARLAQVLDVLEATLPEVRPGLKFGDPWECLVATVLSAQCTDVRVNLVTPGLFARWPNPLALSRATSGEVEAVIRSIGLFRNKARNLIALAGAVAVEHSGCVPADRDSLERLPGVGRKTASVVLSQAFRQPAFAVDTHVARVSVRLGFADRKEPLQVERQVTRLLAPERWGHAHLLLILHGRRTCVARKPRCDECAVAELCPSAGKV